MLDYGIFYEFIKKSDFVSERYSAIPLWEVEKNTEYAMIISTNSGLWRYLIGDTVIFTNTNPFKIKIMDESNRTLIVWRRTSSR